MCTVPGITRRHCFLSSARPRSHSISMGASCVWRAVRGPVIQNLPSFTNRFARCQSVNSAAPARTWHDAGMGFVKMCQASSRRTRNQVFSCVVGPHLHQPPRGERSLLDRAAPLCLRVARRSAISLWALPFTSRRASRCWTLSRLCGASSLRGLLQASRSSIGIIVRASTTNLATIRGIRSPQHEKKVT